MNNKASLGWSILLLIIIIITVPSPCFSSAIDTTALHLDGKTISASDQEDSLRGLEQEFKRADETGLILADYALFLPRVLIDHLLAASGRGISTLAEPQFIEQLEDVLYLYERNLIWYPNTTLNLTDRFQYGLGLMYRENKWKAYTSFLYGSEEKWSTKSKLSYTFQAGKTVWKTAVKFSLDYDDDLRYYGFGSERIDPFTNIPFSDDEDYYEYTQKRRQFAFSQGIRLSNTFEVHYTGLYQKNEIEKVWLNNGSIAQQIRGSDIPDGEQFYNGLMVRYDTRKYKGRISPGARFEAHSGYSHEYSDFLVGFWRGGLDAAVYLPVIKENRIIAGRIVYNVIEKERKTLFYNYPHHRTFRGVSSRYLLRTGHHLAVPSFEYQWPLTDAFSSRLFYDMIVVGDELKQMTLDDAPWAAGLSIELHNRNSSMARVVFAYGSEGVRLTLKLGDPVRSNHPSEWK